MSFHAKNQFPPIAPATQAIFDEGYKVSNVARALFPEGLEVTGGNDLEFAIHKTQELLPEKKPLFEAALK